MNIQVEVILFVLSILFFLSILAGKASSRFGIPALLMFLAVGMLSGSDGLGLHFENVGVAQAVGTIALCIILFSGGMDTHIQEVRPVALQGIILATAGVFIVAIFTGVLIWLVLGVTMQSAGIGILTSMLMASTMASTDSASVFSILRSRGVKLKGNLRPLLELESGSNDPMAYVLVVTFMEIIKMGTSPNYWAAAGMVLVQLLIGTAMGFLLGKLAVFVINRIRIGYDSLYPILVFTYCIFIFSITYFIGGNAFLAVYIGGLVLGNSKFVHKRSALNFFDGLAWMAQLLLFLTLGLLVNPHELIPVLIPGLIISFIMIFLTRPLTVLFCLLPFRKMPFNEKSLVSWVGLRGAVPIIFAIIPLAEGLPHAKLIFNIVFIGTLASLLIQGTSIPMIANWLHLAKPPETDAAAGTPNLILPQSEFKSVIKEIEVTQGLLLMGNQLIRLNIPEEAHVVMIKRDKKFFVPDGDTILKEKDKLLVIANNHEVILETQKNLGVPVGRL